MVIASRLHFPTASVPVGVDAWGSAGGNGDYGISVEGRGHSGIDCCSGEGDGAEEGSKLGVLVDVVLGCRAVLHT